MQRRLFCQLGPTAYRISVAKNQMQRALGNLMDRKIARVRDAQPLPVLIYSHRSLIRRRLGNVDQTLQENKAVSLGIAAPKVSGVIIRPGETFSFWSLVGSCTARKGYREGLVIRSGRPEKGIGGGMCQFTNLIHWMVLHSPLTVTEYHHHNGLDLFPDYNRQVPFGVGTSILFNYLDYRFHNDTDQAFQLLCRVEGEYLWGELRAQRPLTVKYHIRTEAEHFAQEQGTWYRHTRVGLFCIDRKSGNLLSRRVLADSRARVMYDSGLIPKEKTALDNLAQKETVGSVHPPDDAGI